VVNPLSRTGPAARVALLALPFVPLVHLAWLSVAGGAAPSLAAYAEAARPESLAILGRTAAIAAAASAIALVAGGAAAVILETRRFPAAGALRIVLLAPLLLPPVFHVAAWERLAAPGGILAALSGAAVGEPFPIRNAPFAAFLLGIAYAPVAFFFASRALRSVPAELADAAIIGRSPAVAWARVVLPLAAPLVSTGAALVFTLAFLNYETPRLLDLITYPVLIQVSYGVLDDPGRAFAAALPGILLAALPLGLAGAWAARRGFAPVARESAEPLGRGPRPGFGAWAGLAAHAGITGALPLAVLAGLAGPPGTYRMALETDGEKVLWGMATTLAAACACGAGAGLVTLPGAKPRERLPALLWMPVALPSSLLAYSLVRILGSGFLFEIYDSPFALVIAEWLRLFPLACFASAAYLRSVPADTWEAAALGPSGAARWLRARIPLAAPGLAAGAVAAALLAAGDLPAAVLLAAPGHEPLIVRIYNLLHYDPEREICAALSMLHIASVLGVVAGILIAARWIRPRGR
jgi:iron(III) transport system permease protein